VQAVRVPIRHIHTTPAALKKKKKALTSPQEDDSDDFSVDGLPNDNDLFYQTSQHSGYFSAPSAVNDGITRREQFDALHIATMDVLNLRGKIRQPPRKSTVVRLIAMSKSKNDLEKVLELVAAWRNVSQPPEPKTSDSFIGRCENLGHPEIALTALLDRRKYGIDILSLASARRLLHALSRSRPGTKDSEVLADCVALGELYPLYGFPSASKDIVTCAIIASVMSRQMQRGIAAGPSAEEGNDVEDGEALLHEAWREIVSELKTVSKGWDGNINVRARTWLSHSLRDVSLALPETDSSLVAWITHIQEKLRPSNLLTSA